MSIGISAKMSRRKITATVYDLWDEYENGRVFHWYLDGVLKRTETVMEAITEHSYTFANVSYAATHTVTAIIYSALTGNELANLTGSVSDTLKLWDWQLSNGDATDVQTETAYDSAVSKGMTSDFSYKVWNDLVNRADDIAAVLGKSWNGTYAPVDETLMEEANSPLTATRFNALVSNLQYPYPYWARQSDRTGYIGRTAVHGQEEYGENADIVYGAYMIELAHILNVLVDAIGEFNAGYAKRLKHTGGSSVVSWDSLKMRAPASRRMSVSEELWLSGERQKLYAAPSRHLSHDDDLFVEHRLKLRAPPSEPLGAGKRLKTYRSFDLIAQNERPLNHDQLIWLAESIVFEPAASLPLENSLSISSALNGDLLPVASLWLSALSDALKTGEPSVSLATDEETVLGIISGIASALTANLAPIDTTLFDLTWQQTFTTDIGMRTAASKRMGHKAAIECTTQSAFELSSEAMTGLAHTSKGLLGNIHFFNLRSLATRIMNYTATHSLNMQNQIDLETDLAVWFAYGKEEVISTLFAAELLKPKSAKMAYTEEEKIGSACMAFLLPADSVALSFAEEVNGKLSHSAALALPQSYSLSIEATEVLHDICDAAIEAVNAEYLPGIEQTSQSAESIELGGAASTPVAYSDTQKNAVGEADLTVDESLHNTLDGVCVTIFAAALALQPVEIPETDWAEQDGTNLNIMRTYYNHADGAELLLDQAYYVEPVQVGTNLAITSEGYNDYGLEVVDENQV